MTTAEQTELLKAAKWTIARATLRGNDALVREASRAFAALRAGCRLTVAERVALRALGARA